MTDHLARYLFCSTETAQKNLQDEGITESVELVGDITYDAFLMYRRLLGDREKTKPYQIASDKPEKPFYLLTLHRAENTEDPARLSSIVDALNELDDFAGIFPIHPRTKAALEKANLSFKPHIQLIDPVGFFEMLRLEEDCSFFVTDSGGVQKEAYFFGKPCITLRDQTEWVETVESGWNTLVGGDEKRIKQAFDSLHRPTDAPAFFGDGDAGRRILDVIQGSTCKR